MRPFLTACLSTLSFAIIAAAQVKSPAPPQDYDVQLRYKIQADRNERVLQYEALSKFLGSLAFKETETDESEQAPFDPNAQYMSGTVPSKTARDLLGDRRVQTILLAPAGFKAPEDPTQHVRVLIELARSKDQLQLWNQTQSALGPLGFKKDVGFDSRRFTVLRGTVPVGTLPKLLRDLRQQPAGWFLAEQASDLFARLPDGTLTNQLVKPFADYVPVRVVEIVGTVEAAPMIVALPPIPADQPHLAKWTADLRRKLAEEGVNDKPLRLEVVLALAPVEDDREWRVPFNGIGAVIEGRVGPVVTVLVAKGSQAAALAALDGVTSVRLPRVASVDAAEPPAPKKEDPKDDKKLTLASAQEAKTGDADALKQTRLDRLHAIGHQGKGIRIVIVDSDFAGWEKHLTGEKSSRVTFFDLTAERQRNVQPEPMPGDLGRGTRSALAARLAAPAAELTLVRIPADAPYHVVNVARSVRGDDFRTEGMITRRQEISDDYESIEQRRRAARDEYRKAFEDFSDDLAPRQRRIAAQNALKKLDVEEADLLERMTRAEKLEKAFQGLKGAQVVVSLHNWNTGVALDGASFVSRFLDDWLTPTKGAYQRSLTRRPAASPPLWFQPAGDTRGQSWTGLFRDVDSNGVLEFATPEDDLKPGRWSRELNFLSVRSDGKDVLDLTAGAKIRLSVQWREPHDRMLGEADYRVPVAPLRLQLVKQRDPNGEKYASDEIDLVAESEGLPSRLHIEGNFAVYEHTLELTLPADGRYAVRLEGRVPASLRPGTVPTLPSQEVRWELRPRLFVESAGGGGRFSLADYTTADGGVAVPADARSVLAVGAADPSGKPRATSSAGAGPSAELRAKPDLFAPDAFPAIADGASLGTDGSAAFAAGWAASLLSAGVAPASIPGRLGIAAGGAIVVPENVLRR